MIENKRTPAIRFRGFSSEWGERKLGEITSKIGSGKTPLGGESSYVKTGIPLLRSQNIHDDRVDLEDVVFINEDTDISMTNSRVFTNDVLLNITGASIGRSAVYKQSIYANVNQHVCIIRPINEFCSDFIQLNLTSNNGQEQIDSSQAGGAREGLNFQEISKMKFSFPLIDEQKQISKYFNNLDKLISLHQKKHTQLRAIKKAMLEKMFPKEGETIPEIRFAGFTEPWERQKLGEVAEIKDSARIPNEEWTNSGIPYIRASDISNETMKGTLFISSEKYTFYKGKTGAPTKGDVLFNGGGKIGKALVLTDNKPIYVQGGAVLYARTSESQELTGQYLKVYFETHPAKKYIDLASAGGTMKHFTLLSSQKMPIQIPNIVEQQKIGKYFHNLDNLITLQQKKIDQLQHIKKAFLNKMFV